MKRIYLIMLMIAAMMVSCKPKDDDDNGSHGGNGNNGGGGITGIYNPEKKISKIVWQDDVHSSFGGTEDWRWSGDRLQNIIDEGGYQCNFYYNSNGMIESYADDGGEKWIFEYNGNVLSEIHYYDDEDYCYRICKLQYSNGKVSKVEQVWYPYDEDKESYTYVIRWNGANVSEVSMYESNTYYCTITYEYDNKKNPFYSYMGYPIMSDFMHSNVMVLSANNITKVNVEVGSGYEDVNSCTIANVYKYDNDGYPTKVQMTTADSWSESYFSFNIEYLNNGNNVEIDNPDEDWLNIEVDKNVLLEKFTGVRCINCPYANQYALELQQRYGDRLIILNLHAGPLSAPVGTFPNFTTEESAEWFDHFGIEAIPIGLINRKSNEDGYDYYQSEWDSVISDVINEKSFINIIPTINYNNSTRDLMVEIKSQFDKELFGTYNLTVCIMEDYIVDSQVTSQGVDSEYVHHNVFRETMTGAWGDILEPIGDVVKTYSKTLNPNYNDDNCYIIAYISDADTDEIIQVIKKKIT